MHSSEKLFLVDGNISRRAAISHHLAGIGIHAEPFEDADELTTRWPQGGIILVHDEGDAIVRLDEHRTKAGPWLPIIGFSETPTTRNIVRAIHAGASDYVGWPPEDGRLQSSLVEARVATERLGPARTREIRARNRIDGLSRREREVLACVARGLSNRLIGEQLSISPRTVEIHRSNMMSKMGASHVSEAIRAAFDASLV